MESLFFQFLTSIVQYSKSVLRCLRSVFWYSKSIFQNLSSGCSAGIVLVYYYREKEEDMAKKAIVLHSGGLDSTVLLFHVLKNLGFDVSEVVTLSVYYGQRHARELKAAQELNRILGVEHFEIQIPTEKIFSTSALVDKSKELPNQHYTHENQKVTVVPNRNMILLSFAIAYAENIGAKFVYYAAHKNDYTIYPDCRPEFVEVIDKASQVGTYNQVNVCAPFVDLYKADIVSIGLKLDVPFELTWSCYNGGEFPCSFKNTKSFEEVLGKGCATCQERNEAFFVNKVVDPLYNKYLSTVSVL